MAHAQEDITHTNRPFSITNSQFSSYSICQFAVLLAAYVLVCGSAGSVKPTPNRYRDIKKNDTETDVGVEKTEKNRKPRKKNEKPKNSVFKNSTLWSHHYEQHTKTTKLCTT